VTLVSAGRSVQRVAVLSAALALLAAPPCAAQGDGTAPRGLFYHGYEYGSESEFNPITSFLNYAFDSLQIPQSFDDRDLDDRFYRTWRSLRDPLRTIERTGGYGRFINRQVLPINPAHPEESLETVPNYALHLVGGGLVYRRNVEWFQAHRYPYPHASAFLLGMAAELLQEMVERKSTRGDDPVADFYLFRPAGMLLFSWEPFARFAAETLELREWPYQPMYDPGRGRFVNAGENYVVRPAVLGEDAPRFFLHFGFTTLGGLSHVVRAGERVSWGIGGAVQRGIREDFAVRPSGGLFYDRNGSLLASLIINGTDDLRLRLNLYPGVLGRGRWSPGVFVGIGDGGELALGIMLQFVPMGVAGSAR
jgi:hypothetical protein